MTCRSLLAYYIALSTKLIKYAEMKLSEDCFKDFDQKRILSILLELGLIDQFPKPPEGHPYSGVVSYTIHPTHWLFFVRLTGFKEPEDNGYMLNGFSKKSYSWDQAHGEFSKTIGTATLSEPETIWGNDTTAN